MGNAKSALRSALASTMLAGLVTPSRAMAQQAVLKAQCEQLIAYYDYYGVSRSKNSDGARNHHRIKAELECQS